MVSWWEGIDEHSGEMMPGRNTVNKVPLSTWSLHGFKTSRGAEGQSDAHLADFSNAAQVTLEAAQLSLVREHRRMLAAREAVLCREIVQLRQELSKLRTDPSSQDDVRVDYPTDLTGATDLSEGNDSPHPRAIEGSSAQRCESPGLGLVMLETGADKKRSGSTCRVSSLAWDGVDRVATRRSDAMQLRPPTVQSPQHEGLKRTSCKSAASVASSSNTSAMAYQSTWKRTADTVIYKAGMEFLGDGGGHDGDVTSIGSWIRPTRPWQSWVMETIIGFVIIFNTMTVGISTEVRPQWTGWIFFDMVFGAVFTTEFLLKVCVLGCRGYFCGPDSRWNNFEAILVLLAWVEISLAMLAEETDMSKSMLFRMMRLLRLAKLARILRLQVFCELLMIINGATSSWKTLLYSMVLICMPLYGVALLLKDMLADSHGRGAENFEQLQLAFFTVFRCFVANDCTQEDGKPLFLLVTKEHGFVYGVLYCLVQFLMTFGLFNVIVAIYVENTVSAARFNDLFVKRERLRDRKYFENKAQALLKMIWNSYYKNDPEMEEVEAFNLEAAGKLNLSQEFFEELCAKHDFVDILRDLDISEDDQRDLFETLDVEGRGCIDLTDLIMGIGKLRGQARKADVVSMGLLLRSLQHKLLLINAKMSRGLRTNTATTASHSLYMLSHDRSSTMGVEGPLESLT